MIDIYTDGACIWNPGPGGWAAVIVQDGEKRMLSGREERTTNNRMELMAAIKGLEAIPQGSEVTLYSDSEYLVKSMKGQYRRRANLDLWDRLDSLSGQRTVQWEWVQGHSGHPGNEEANALAGWQAGIEANGPPPSALTHVDESGHTRMVDVGEKPDTERVAVAKGSVVMKKETLALIKEGGFEKGDVLGTARIAGIMGAKKTSELIPLCHPLPLNQVIVDLDLDEVNSAVRITATAKAIAKTGVEMEALTAVVTAALTIYDMCKAVDRGMKIEGVRLVRKSGGRSGDIVLE